MKKRLIALAILVCMLVSVSPTVAADDTVPRPTVEEILSEYHEKAFEEKAAERSGGVSTYSRGATNSGKTLEEETVDTLNAAGYEAYNVTSENYETLEEQLQTDFADMGLDPDGSYIITLSGDESGPSNNSRLIPGTIPTLPPDGGGPTFFTYTYNGNSYSMRYVTVTATEESNLYRSFYYTLGYDEFPGIWDEMLVAGLAYVVDSGTVIPIASIGSLLMDISDNNYVSLLNNQDITVLGNTTWTLRYIQIYSLSAKAWVSVQSTESAESRVFCTGYLYNSVTNKAERFVGDESVFTTYARRYTDEENHKKDAVKAYLQGNGAIFRDTTGDIDFYLMDEEYEFNYCGEGEPLFTQPHWNI